MIWMIEPGDCAAMKWPWFSVRCSRWLLHPRRAALSAGDLRELARTGALIASEHGERHARVFISVAELSRGEMRIAAYIDGFYNATRRHSHNRYQSSIDFELEFVQQGIAA